MGLRSRIECWLEEVLPYTDRATARRRQERFERQLAKSRVIQAQATTAIVEAQRDRRAHMRGSYKRADDRLARR
jgi:hypothetical protein